jgi:hypothetical protein
MRLPYVHGRAASAQPCETDANIRAVQAHPVHTPVIPRIGHSGERNPNSVGSSGAGFSGKRDDVRSVTRPCRVRAGDGPAGANRCEPGRVFSRERTSQSPLLPPRLYADDAVRPQPTTEGEPNGLSFQAGDGRRSACGAMKTLGHASGATCGEAGGTRTSGPRGPAGDQSRRGARAFVIQARDPPRLRRGRLSLRRSRLHAAARRRAGNGATGRPWTSPASPRHENSGAIN